MHKDIPLLGFMFPRMIISFQIRFRKGLFIYLNVNMRPPRFVWVIPRHLVFFGSKKPRIVLSIYRFQNKSYIFQEVSMPVLVSDNTENRCFLDTTFVRMLLPQLRKQVSIFCEDLLVILKILNKAKIFHSDIQYPFVLIKNCLFQVTQTCMLLINGSYRPEIIPGVSWHPSKWRMALMLEKDLL